MNDDINKRLDRLVSDLYYVGYDPDEGSDGCRACGQLTSVVEALVDIVRDLNV